MAAQIHHGLREAGYGYWGFSPADVPEGGYRVYGVDRIGSDPGGNPSNDDGTLIDHGFAGCPGREPQPDPPPSAYTNGVVTPQAAFLGLRYAPRETLANLARLERDFDVYTPWGFLDPVNVDSGVVSTSYLSLDQGMIMAAIGNALGGEALLGDGGRGRLEGGDGENALYGGEDDDGLDGERGNDVLSGGPGADALAPGRGDHLEPGD